MEAVGLTCARPDREFWAGRRVLVTGHTGFKGAWLCLMLDRLGARVSGLALAPEPGAAFDAMRPDVTGALIDIRDANAVAETVQKTQPEIVLHLAAQALVGVGYTHPLDTFMTNVMGTAHVLQALCAAPAAVALVVTSDKVYRVDGREVAFDEDSPLGGTDPYSASKAAAEHVAACWRMRLADVGCKVATARAGNVIGGGDHAVGRLVPDVLRACHAGESLVMRQPQAVRPWQYVLDVLSGYLLYVQALLNGKAPQTLNFGPPSDYTMTAANLAGRLQRKLGVMPEWRQGAVSFAETVALRLDPGRAEQTLGWRACTDIDLALDWTAAWQQAAWRGEDMRRVGLAQIAAWGLA